MGRCVFAVAALFALADALSVRSRALPRVAPARRPAAAPPTMMSQTEKSNKSKLQTIVKDKIDEETKVKEDQSLEEPWRAPGARPKAPAPRAPPIASRAAARRPRGLRPPVSGGSCSTTTTSTPSSTSPTCCRRSSRRSPTPKLTSSR